MKMEKIFFLCIALALPVSAAVQAGFAERDITPGIGQERPGGYRKAFHRSFQDPCKVRAAVFTDGTRKVAIVGIDALVIHRPVVQAARAEIARVCHIPAEAVMIAATHSHSSGPTSMVQPGEFDQASPEVRRLAYEETSVADPGYLLRVTREIVQAVSLASAGCVPAELGFGYGHENQSGFNRRYRMKNGQTWTNPGAMNPDIIDYAGPIDPQVGVVGAWDVRGKLLGVVVNYASHAHSMVPGISANWIYHLERTIQGAFHAPVPVIFLAGACGDVGKKNSLSPDLRPEDRVMEIFGTRIGAEAVKVLVTAPRSAEVPLDTRSRVWRIKRRAPSSETLQRAKARVAAKSKSDLAGLNDWTYAKEIVLLEHLIATQPDVEVEVQAIQVGPVAFVSNPAEYFVEYGLEIKQRSPFPFTFPVELANGCVGYVPTEEAFGERGGGYETRLTSYSNLEITAGRQFADTGVALVSEMKPGPVPAWPQVKKAEAPWPSGNVPPQRN